MLSRGAFYMFVILYNHTHYVVKYERQYNRKAIKSEFRYLGNLKKTNFRFLGHNPVSSSDVGSVRSGRPGLRTYDAKSDFAAAAYNP